MTTIQQCPDKAGDGIQVRFGSCAASIFERRVTVGEVNPRRRDIVVFFVTSIHKAAQCDQFFVILRHHVQTVHINNTEMCLVVIEALIDLQETNCERNHITEVNEVSLMPLHDINEKLHRPTNQINVRPGAGLLHFNDIRDDLNNALHICICKKSRNQNAVFYAAAECLIKILQRIIIEIESYLELLLLQGGEGQADMDDIPRTKFFTNLQVSPICVTEIIPANKVLGRTDFINTGFFCHSANFPFTVILL